MTDEADDELELEVEGEEGGTDELFLSDGEAWFVNGAALCEQYGIVGFSVCDGGVLAFVPGEGAVELGAFLKKAKKPALAAVK